MTQRHPEVLVAPTVTFVAVLVLIGFARIYDSLPVQAPDCGFRETFGIPCISCGGTRALQSLSFGHFIKAIGFNPAVIMGVAAAGIWFITGLARYRNGKTLKDVSEIRITGKTLGLCLFTILTLNWIYLIIFLP